jgi:hypothetical protein
VTHERAYDRDGSVWAWLPLGLLLALQVRIALTEIFSFSFEPGFFLPLLAAGLASRFGRSAFALLCVFAVLTVFNVWMSNDVNLLYFGFSTENFALAVFAAAAFVQPPVALAEGIVILPWRRIAQLALVLLVIARHARLSIDRAFTDTLTAHAQPVTAAAFLILAATVRWPEVVRRAARGTSLPATVVVAFVALFAVAALFDVEYGDEVRLGFGISRADDWLFALCFACAAARLVSWPWLLVLLVAGYAGEVAVIHLDTMLHPAGESMAGVASGGVGDIVVTGTHIADRRNILTLMICASAALLGAALSPFWRERLVAPLRSWQTLCLLGAALTLQLFAPTVSFYVPAPGIVGGCAFVCGLAWRGRGVILAPLVIQLACVIAAVAVTDDPRSTILSEEVRIGAIVFPFAFIGLLANRWAVRTSA